MSWVQRKPSDVRLVSGHFLPLLASLHGFVTVEAARARWNGGFRPVPGFWDVHIEALLRIVHQRFVEGGRNPNKPIRAKLVWGQNHQQLRIWQLEQMASKG